MNFSLSMSRRDDFPEEIKKNLAGRVGYTCSNPNCKQSTIGPSTTSSELTQYGGIAAHIESASATGGPRANPSLTSEQRSSIENGIHLCATCASLIDKNSGIDYPVALLRKWKENAEQNALQRLYASLPAESWRRVTFENLEIEYSAALSCTSLSERHVNSCPKNEKLIKFIVVQLELCYHCLLIGESGVGKSLVSYQVAHQFHVEDWHVFEYLKNDHTIPTIPFGRKCLLIVDNAQSLEPITVRNLISMSHSDCFVIFTWNKSTNVIEHFQRANNRIEINSKEQVQALGEYCLKNKSVVLEKIKNLDDEAVDLASQLPIEYKIKRAMQQATPWLFNYELSSGWRSATHEFNLLHSKHRLDVALHVIAIFQIVSLDAGTHEGVIWEQIRKFNSDPNWLADAEAAIHEYGLRNGNRLRLKHLQYGRRFLALIKTEKDERIRTFLFEVCKTIFDGTEFRRGFADLIEFLMYDLFSVHYLLRKNIIYENLLKNILHTNIEMEPHDILTVCSLSRAIGQNNHILIRHNEVIKHWLNKVTSSTAIAYSSLINELYNKKIEGTFIDNIMLQRVRDGIQSENIVDAGKYATLLERLQVYVKDDKCADYRNSFIHLNLETIARKANQENIYYFNIIADAIWSMNKKAAEQLLSYIPDLIAKVINKNPIEGSLQVQEIFFNIFGMMPLMLGIYKVEKYDSELAKTIIERFDAEILAKALTNLQIRDSERLSRLFLFIFKYNAEKIAAIMRCFSFRFDKIEFREELDRGVRQILRIFYHIDANDPNLTSFLDSLLETLNTYAPAQLILSGEKCLNKLMHNEQKTILFDESNDYETFRKLLVVIQKDGRRTACEKIIRTNQNLITDGLFSTAVNIDGSRKKLRFYIYLAHAFPTEIAKACTESKAESFLEKIARLKKGSFTEKGTAYLYQKIYASYKDKFAAG